MESEATNPRPQVTDSIVELRASVAAARRMGKSVGFVPTMGALHAGHVSLIERARQDCGFIVVSIFVNPTQFGPNEDFQQYPRPRDTDLNICGSASADIVFYPTVQEIYPAGYRTFVEVQGLSDVLEGAIRPGHFRGVATVVAKLLMIVGSDKAYFGQKDFQQQLIIRTMARELNIPTQIVTCPTQRDPDGLAMSSRNAYLSPNERDKGLCLSRALWIVAQMVDRGERDMHILESALRDTITSTNGVDLDYAVIVDGTTLVESTTFGPDMVALVAARIGTTRLIDNLFLFSRNSEAAG